MGLVVVMLVFISVVFVLFLLFLFSVRFCFFSSVFCSSSPFSRLLPRLCWFLLACQCRSSVLVIGHDDHTFSCLPAFSLRGFVLRLVTCFFCVFCVFVFDLSHSGVVYLCNLLMSNGSYHLFGFCFLSVFVAFFL